MLEKNKVYRGFLIDADDTIFDFNRCEREALIETVGKASPMYSADEIVSKYHSINMPLWRAFENGKINSHEINTERFILLCRVLDLKINSDRLAADYLNSLSQKSYLFRNVLPVLEKLSRKASLYLITNGFASVQKGRLARAGIEIFFSGALISEEVGLAKPDPRFFWEAAKRIFLSPHEILCVGDDPSTDIRGGYLSGMDTCWYMHKPRIYPMDEPEPDYTITDFRELLGFTPAVS